MATDPKALIEELLRKALQEKAPQSADTPIVIERPKQTGHGDFSSNVALQAAKTAKMKPRDLAVALQESIAAQVSASATLSDAIEKPEIAGPGFINFKLKAGTKTAVIRRILEEGAVFGRVREGQGQKVQVEFVSANPTGPLHVGHGRQAALGDAIAALLESQGYAVTREFYYNDSGAQIEKLALSVQARARGIHPGAPGWPEEGYAGE
ncbi:MAG TPA: arginine--tRNA ligase, partial [Burkholderiales bacterium]|nr:arginine--tRNA ligase [Burkholderiales bacterium]